MTLSRDSPPGSPAGNRLYTNEGCGDDIRNAPESLSLSRFLVLIDASFKSSSSVTTHARIRCTEHPSRCEMADFFDRIVGRKFETLPGGGFCDFDNFNNNLIVDEVGRFLSHVIWNVERPWDGVAGTGFQ